MPGLSCTCGGLATEELHMKRNVGWPLLLCLWPTLLVAPSSISAVEKTKEDIREVVVDRLMLTSEGFAVALRAVNSVDRIEMIVGFSEGHSINLAQQKKKAARPLTHDIFKKFLDRNGWQVERVVVRDLVNGTFLANLTFHKDGRKQTYDARPSDSIALALRSGAKIFVADKVFQLQQREEEKIPGKRGPKPGIA